jgi:hypothetical protein
MAADQGNVSAQYRYSIALEEGWIGFVGKKESASYRNMTNQGNVGVQIYYAVARNLAQSVLTKIK